MHRDQDHFVLLSGAGPGQVIPDMTLIPSVEDIGVDSNNKAVNPFVRSAIHGDKLHLEKMELFITHVISMSVRFHLLTSFGFSYINQIKEFPILSKDSKH